NYNPSTHFTATEALEPWKEMVEKETNGRVKVNLFHGGALGSVRSVLQDVENRAYEVGMFINHYYEDTSAYPLSIGYLPFALPSGDVARDAMLKLNEKYKDMIWGDLDAIPMGMMASAPNIFLS